MEALKRFAKSVTGLFVNRPGRLISTCTLVDKCQCPTVSTDNRARRNEDNQRDEKGKQNKTEKFVWQTVVVTAQWSVLMRQSVENRVFVQPGNSKRK